MKERVGDGILIIISISSIRTHTAVPRSTQPCIHPGSLNRVPAYADIRAGMSPLPGGRLHCVIP